MIGMRKLYLTHFQLFLIILTILTKNHGILEILTKIQFHHKTLNLTNIIDKLASFYFNEIELEDECDTDSQYCDSVPLFESMQDIRERER